MSRFAFIFALLMLITTRAIADGSLPDRVIKSFDFEERDRGNAEELPADWVKVESSGYPHYNNGQLASDQAANGKYSFRFNLHGGNLTYRYPTGKISVFPFACYRINANVKADRMEHARLRISGYFTDQYNRPIRSTIKHSDPYEGGPEWKPMQIELDAPEDAKFLVLELELIQPQVWQETTLGSQALYEQDIEVSAWFDDVVVTQVPRLYLSTAMPANVFRRDDPLALQISIADRRKHDLDGTLVVRDYAGKVVFQQNGQLDAISQRQYSDDTALQKTTIQLPNLNPGYYQATLELTSQGHSLGAGTLALLRLADDTQQIDPDKRFGIIATNLPMRHWEELAKILPMLGASHVKISAWNSQTRLEGDTMKTFSSFLEKLRNSRTMATACLVSPPPEVAMNIGGSTWGHLLKSPPQNWQTQLSYLVSRFSGQIDSWQFGSDDQADLFTQSAIHRDTYSVIQKEFEGLVSDPRLAMPWPAYMDASTSAPKMLALNIPSDLTPAQIPIYIEDFKKHNPSAISVVLNPLPVETYGRDARLRDFFQRIVYTLSTGVERIDLPLPYKVTTINDNVTENPDELFMVIRTLIKHLSMTHFQGKLPIGDDIEAYLFDRNGEGVVLMWSTADIKSPPKTAQVFLGNQPRKVDVFGNVSPVLKPRDSSGMIDLIVNHEPMILIGIDGDLARFRSSFAIDNPVIESSFKAHSRKLSFYNPYNVPIFGRFRIVGPTSWNVTAQTPTFTLNPGEKFECPLTIEFPFNSFAGNKSLDVAVDLQSAGNAKIHVPLNLKLGLGEIGMTTIAVRDKNDIYVQQVVTNYSDKPINYNAYAFVSGLPREDRLILDLKPGRTTIKKYRFNNVGFPSNGEIKVRSGLKESDGQKVLNDETSVR